MAQEILNKNKIINSRWKFVGIYLFTLFISFYGIDYYRSIGSKIKIEDGIYFLELNKILVELSKFSETIVEYKNDLETPNKINLDRLSAILAIQNQNLYNLIGTLPKSNPSYSNIEKLINLLNLYKVDLIGFRASLMLKNKSIDSIGSLLITSQNQLILKEEIIENFRSQKGNETINVPENTGKKRKNSK